MQHTLADLWIALDLCFSCLLCERLLSTLVCLNSVITQSAGDRRVEIIRLATITSVFLLDVVCNSHRLRFQWFGALTYELRCQYNHVIGFLPVPKPYGGNLLVCSKAPSTEIVRYFSILLCKHILYVAEVFTFCLKVLRRPWNAIEQKELWPHLRQAGESYHFTWEFEVCRSPKMFSSRGNHAKIS